MDMIDSMVTVAADNATRVHRRIILPLVVTCFLCVFANAQSAAVSEDPESLRQVLSIQPDYTAIRKFIFLEGLVGFGADSKIVKMGNRYAEVVDDTIFISETGRPTIKVFPKRKEYSEVPLEKADDFTTSPEELAKRSDTIFKSLGTEKVGKYTCIKIEVSYKDEKLKDVRFWFWAATSLKNLVIKSVIFSGQRVQSRTLLEGISFKVNEELFRIPARYKKVAR